MSYDIIFNGMKQSDFDLEIIKRPFIPVPKKKIKNIEISQSDGSYYVDDFIFDDIPITIEFNFIENDLDNIRHRTREITFWLTEINDNKLRLMNDFEYYYKVKNVEISEYTYDEIYEIQKFTVTFICEPWQYLYNNRERLLNNVEFNGLYLSKPIYRISGNGKCDFTVNGTKISCDVNKELIIDTKYDKILEADKTPAIGKTNIKAMQDLFFKHGKNYFEWSNGFKIYYIPNYRAI